MINITDRISSNPKICGGEPCINGTRIPVQVILSHLAAEDSIEILLENFPRITREDIQACLSYAAYHCTEATISIS